MKFSAFFRRHVLKNWVAKLTCLLLALGLWFWVAVQHSGSAEFTVPVEFMDVPEGYVVGRETPGNVEVVLHGPKTVLSDLRGEAMEIVISLSDFEDVKTSQDLQIMPRHVRHPRQTAVRGINPRTIRVSLEPVLTKKVQVVPQLTGPQLENYSYRSSLNPDTALLVGPERELRRREKISLEQVAWPGPDDSPARYSLKAILGSGVELEYPPDNIFQLKVKVMRRESTREFKNIPVEVTSVSGDVKVTVEPDSVDVSVKGPLETVRQLKRKQVRVEVEAPGETGTSIKRARVLLPDQVETVDEEESYRKVKVTTEAN